MYKVSVVRFQRLLLVVGFALLAACGGGSGGGSSTEQASQPQRFIAGAGIKGPLAFASVELYVLDTRFGEFYEPGNPIAAATTDAYAQITGLAVPADIAPPYILIIDGTNAIDLNTGVAPVISKMVTVITQESLDSGKPVYATPYTTLAYQMLRLESPGDGLQASFLDDLSIGNDLVQFNQDIVQAIGFHMQAETDIFTTPPIITADSTSIEEQQMVINYRAAIEALSSLLYKMSLSSEPSVSTDLLLERLALDLHSDSVIDNSASGLTIGGIDTVVLSQNPMLLDIPNTSYRVQDTVDMMYEERSIVGSSSNIEFLIEDIAVTLEPPLLSNQLDSTQEVGYTEPVGNATNTILLTGLIASTPVGGEVLLYHDFNNDAPGIYTLDDIRQNWSTSIELTSISMRKGNETSQIAQDPNGTRGNVMSVFFKQGVRQYNVGENGKTADACCSGTQWATRLKPSDELYLAYDVMFEPGFDFSRGGKLPGLFGGPEFISGGEETTGYDGWSGRMKFEDNGRMTAYVYHAGKSGNYGQNFEWKNANGEPTHFIPGKWHTMEIRYVINTPGVADGIIQAWFDGQLALDTGKRFLFRNTDAFSIDGLMVTTYFGGGWVSPKDQYVYFDNFVVSTKPITH